MQHGELAAGRGALDAPPAGIAAGSRCAVEITGRPVESDARERFATVRAGNERVEYGVFAVVPQLENHAAAMRSASLGGAVKIAAVVPLQIAIWIRTVAAAEAVQECVAPGVDIVGANNGNQRHNGTR